MILFAFIIPSVKFQLKLLSAIFLSLWTLYNKCLLYGSVCCTNYDSILYFSLLEWIIYSKYLYATMVNQLINVNGD